MAGLQMRVDVIEAVHRYNGIYRIPCCRLANVDVGGPLPPGMPSSMVSTMETDARLVLCTVPAGEIAVGIARELVQRRLAACVNVVPGVTSIYRWKGSVESETEQLLVIKTRGSLLDSLQQTIQDLHPYELPEIIVVPIVCGLPAYLSWITENTGA